MTFKKYFWVNEYLYTRNDFLKFVGLLNVGNLPTPLRKVINLLFRQTTNYILILRLESLN